MTKAVLGIIGGSGVYDLPGLEKVRSKAIKSPWGDPSGPLRIGQIAGATVRDVYDDDGLRVCARKPDGRPDDLIVRVGRDHH